MRTPKPNLCSFSSLGKYPFSLPNLTFCFPAAIFLIYDLSYLPLRHPILRFEFLLFWNRLLLKKIFSLVLPSSYDLDLQSDFRKLPL